MAKKSSSKNENSNLVHVKLEFEEAVRSKKSLLTMQMWLLKSARNIEKYKLLRIEELELKEKLREKSNQTKKQIKKLKSILPHPKIPKSIKKPGEGREESGIRHIENKDNKIETQLLEIQRRLDALQSENI